MGGVIHMLEETMVKVGCDHPRRPKRKKEIAMRIEKMRMSTNMLSTRGSRRVVLRGTVRCLLNRTLKMEDIGVGCGRSRKGEGVVDECFSWVGGGEWIALRLKSQPAAMMGVILKGLMVQIGFN